MKQLRPLLLLLGLMLLVAACQPASVDQSTATPASVSLPTLEPTLPDSGVLAPRATPDLAQLPLLAAHLARVQEALQETIPIVPIEDGLDDEQRQAQSIALSEQLFRRYARDPQTQAPFRSEIMGIYPLRASDIVEKTAVCAANPCYRVEMYNYALNFFVAAVADLREGRVLDVIGYEDAQPDIPASLTQVALEIAVHAPEVQEALGYTPETSDAVMASTKTSLNSTVCERSRHLCVAPTFVVGERALWAIVDLTDGRLVGVRWTAVGSSVAITEKRLEDETIMRQFCQQNTPLEQAGWSLNYTLTSSDGLRISEVTYQGTPIFDSVKLVDWHVSYSATDGFGYSDAVGCPVFSQAAVIAIEPPRVTDMVVDGGVVGFALEQGFWSELWPLPCNYFYKQRYEFYNDGRFRPLAINVGRGCGNDGTYRPVTRIALAGSASTFSEWGDSGWQAWTSEGWRLAADVSSNDDGYSFQISSANSSFYVAPSTGQFGDGGRGDNAFVYVTLHHADRDEGDSDMPTIGPCCNTDYQQGPERFIDPTPEAITDNPLVLWYVAQIKNDDTPGAEYCWAETVLENGLYADREYPCPSGPMFVPTGIADANAG